ncbi:MAG: ABC transporter ATP-binding protein [Butyricicoccus sp.]|nr:ABC transporter ATP-binding protein [Butyricicoccus sp.]
MDEPILQVRGLHYAYDEEKHALDNISLDIHAGERIAVLGTNGAGKSTFFLCLNGVLEPHEGEILLHGQTVEKRTRNALREHVGVVFQNADDQIIASTVLAEVSFGPMNLRLPRAEVERRVDLAITAMDLEDYRHRPPHYLSGGEKKRVSIADIIAMESEVILFDEPAASLDPVGTEMLEQVLEGLSAAGKTLMISTHDMDFAFRWAERVVVFSGGHIIDDGDPLSVFRNEETVLRANLRRPAMLTVFESLRAHGMLPAGAACPRTPQELDALLDKARA